MKAIVAPHARFLVFTAVLVAAARASARPPIGELLQKWVTPCLMLYVITRGPPPCVSACFTSMGSSSMSDSGGAHRVSAAARTRARQTDRRWHMGSSGHATRVKTLIHSRELPMHVTDCRALSLAGSRSRTNRS